MKIVPSLCVTFCCSVACAQTATAPVRAYFECLAATCGVVVPVEDVPFVQWVRNLADADVSVLVTQQPSAGGGATVTIVAADANARAPRADTVVFSTLAGASGSVVRTAFARWLRIALLRFAAARSADGLDVTYTAPSRLSAAAPPHDPWKSWTITVAGSALLDDQQQSRMRSGSLGAVGTRVTSDWRISLGGGSAVTEARTTLSDGSIYRATTRTDNSGALVVRSMGEHWGVGALGSTTRSDYLNEQRVIRAAVAAEYNVFPYSVATHRELTMRYQIGENSYRFSDTTIFGRIHEVRPNQSMVLAYSTQSVWGSIDSDLTWSRFLDAPSFYSALLEVNANLTITKGLTLNVSATVERVHDQIYLRREALTDNDILAQQKALATTYHSSLSVGLTYTFGSILSSVVNSRFAGSGVSPSGRVPTSGF